MEQRHKVSTVNPTELDVLPAIVKVLEAPTHILMNGII